MIARNPDQDSAVPFLIRLPLGEGMVFRTKGTWPRETTLFCYPVSTQEWPAQPDVLERVVLRACIKSSQASTTRG